METFSKYPEELVSQMRNGLRRLGVAELRTAQEVEQALSGRGALLMVVNSVCACMYGTVIPGLRLALENEYLPDRVISVFAGVDHEAVERMRSLMPEIPKSSPALILIIDGRPRKYLLRDHVEGEEPEALAEVLTDWFDTYCKKSAAATA